jgi:peptidoglycan hydrolase CwlO-like protein
VLDRHHEFEQLRERVAEQKSALPETALGREALGRAGRKLTDAMEAASRAEKELRQLIREELRSKPEAAMPPAAVPAKRRRSWFRRKDVDD